MDSYHAEVRILPPQPASAALGDFSVGRARKARQWWVLRIGYRSLCSGFDPCAVEIADSFPRAFEKFPFSGDCGRRPGSICTAWPPRQS